MSFKDQLAKDIEGVFFNTDEFAEEHLINDKPVKCVVEKDESDKWANQRYEMMVEANGTFISMITVLLPKSAINFPLVEGQLIKFDNLRYKIESVQNQGGVYEVKLSRGGV